MATGAADLLKLMGSPALASRRWVWEQYDQSVGANTVQRPGGDAAVVRVHGSKKALAITTDCTPRYCYADPVEGGKQAVAEAYRNLCAVGAKPLAVTNCLNFGNPQRPVSGNVSLYNETKNEDGSSTAILPTPAIGGVGLLDDWEKSATIGFKGEGEAIWLLGGRDLGHLAQSIWLRDLHGQADGPPPQVYLNDERFMGEAIRNLISSGAVTAVHDVSDGGWLVALAEMALAGGLGATLSETGRPEKMVRVAWYFGEEQGRYLVTLSKGEQFDIIHRTLNPANSPRYFLGTVGGTSVDGPNFNVPLADLRAAHEGFFPKLMGSELTPEF